MVEGGLDSPEVLTPCSLGRTVMWDALPPFTGQLFGRQGFALGASPFEPSMRLGFLSEKQRGALLLVREFTLNLDFCI